MAADRQDLDALLIGALYGELDGDERARLDAHLASHPQDRSALDGLRATRAMLRDADVAAYLGAAEPAPAISARLLQEAARRAPARAAGGGFGAWLSSLFRPFVASPALSAATALVLVGGAAGLMYARGSFNSAEPRAEAPAYTAGTRADSGEGAAALAPAPVQPAPAGGAPADDYRVALDEQPNATGTAVTVDGLADGKFDDSAPGQAKDRGNELAFQPESTARAGTSRKGAGTRAEPAKRTGYLPLDPVKKDSRGVLSADGDALEESERDKSGVAGTAGGGGADGNFTATLEGRAPTAPTATAPAPVAPPPAPKPAQIARDAGKATPSGNTAAAAALDAWARDQHARMIALVKKGSCTDAGAIGAEIVRRAPDYYAANVANDRQVRSCRSYVDRARRARSEDIKSKAASPRAPSPDTQVDLESAN